MHKNIRSFRLRSDWDKLQRLAQRSPLLEILAADGDPPERYLLQFTCRALVKLADGSIGEADQHLVEVYLPSGYPRLDAPLVVHRAPPGLFHPNVSARPGQLSIICLGAFLPEQGLDWVCWRVFQVLSANNFAMSERFSLNPEAAAWYRAHQERFPTETRAFLGRAEETSHA